MNTTNMELLAPAGNWDAFLAAIKNGADAVYLGGKNYSARQSAANFDDNQLEEAINYAHLHGKKVYVTVNTLIDNSEFSDLLDYLYKIQQMAVDAVIIQDIGLMDAVLHVLPELRLHASTQMTVHNSAGVAFLRDQGIKRAVLARELSSQDIYAISQEAKGVELEVFVHGALCYSYSGQCLFSSMVGGRSGNRGHCAQPCRLSYDLYSRLNQRQLNTGDHGKYLLSLSDLCLIEYLPELKSAGVTSLKLEGRLKRPEYVAVITSTYREALNNLQKYSGFRPDPDAKKQMLKVFNRNFSTGYFISSQDSFLSSRRPNNRGVYIGRVIEQNRNRYTKIKLSDSLCLGDGLVIWVGKGKAPAFKVREMQIDDQPVNEAGRGDIVSIQLETQVFPEDRVFKTHDERLLSGAMDSIKDETGHKLPIDARVFLNAGQPMKLVLTDEKGNQAEVQTESEVQKADKYPLEPEVLRDKIGRLGNTPFILRDLIVHGDEDLMVPFSEINEARRKAAELLNKKLLQANRAVYIEPQTYRNSKKSFLQLQPKQNKAGQTKLSVSVSTLEQARVALDNGADMVYLGLEGIQTHRRIQKEQLGEFLKSAEYSLDKIVPMLPRIHTPNDKFPYTDIAELGFPNLMIGNWGDLIWGQNKGLNLLTDYNFNVFNSYALGFLIKQGISGVCLSPELNLKQLQSFAKFDKVEMLVHGELIIMQSQYCMLRDVLGTGGEKCSASCLQDQYALKDDKGYSFPITTDADCKFYVFNSRTLCMIEDLSNILALNPASIRIEARCGANLPGNDKCLATTVNIYRDAIDRLLNGDRIDLTLYKEELLNVSSSSFTKGHYYRGVL